MYINNHVTWTKISFKVMFINENVALLAIVCELVYFKSLYVEYEYICYSLSVKHNSIIMIT